jgi:hypothetical protein
METAYFLNRFAKGAGQIDRDLLSLHEMDYRVGIWLRSVALKLQKPSWLNPIPTARPFEESIFFSIWVNEESILQHRLNYNIHALQLRTLRGYAIKSREFAADFRERFSPFAHKWPNVSLDFGPLTLMEGWVDLDMDRLENRIVELSGKFFELHPIIDELLLARVIRARP